MKKIDNVMFFSNGNVAAFSDGKQIPDAQINFIEEWARQMYDNLGYDLSKCFVETPYFKGHLIKDDGGNWRCSIE